MTLARVFVTTPDACALLRVRAAWILDELAALAAMLRPGVRITVDDDQTGREIAAWRVEGA